MKQGIRILPVIALVLASAASAVEVRDVRLWRAPDHTRIVFDLTAPTSHKLIVRENPSRIGLDVSDTALKTPLNDLELGNTPIKNIRSGVRDGDDLRVVLDMSTTVNPRSFALKANEQADDRLVLDLYDKKSERTQPKKVSSPTTNGKRDLVIAIDAGHGGEDPGALGPKRLREKDVVLAIAKELHALFAKEPGFKPTLIRSGDYYISLKGRRDLARKRQADMFVSIHADAFDRKQAHGASVYALSLRGATSTAARHLAQRENASDLVGGTSLSDKDDVLAGVLADLSMTNTLDSSLKIGSSVLRRMDDIAHLHKKQVEQAGFAVLKSPDVPSILVETGFISNPGEARKLGTRSYQQRMAKQIFYGIRDWWSANPTPGTLLAWRRQQEGEQYVIARGDTLSGIAQRFNVSVDALKTHNGLRSNSIQAGKSLKIPAT